jgi:hypothetical protein
MIGGLDDQHMTRLEIEASRRPESIPNLQCTPRGACGVFFENFAYRSVPCFWLQSAGTVNSTQL